MKTLPSAAPADAPADAIAEAPAVRFARGSLRRNLVSSLDDILPSKLDFTVYNKEKVTASSPATATKQRQQQTQVVKRPRWLRKSAAPAVNKNFMGWWLDLSDDKAEEKKKNDTVRAADPPTTAPSTEDSNTPTTESKEVNIEVTAPQIEPEFEHLDIVPSGNSDEIIVHSRFSASTTHKIDTSPRRYNTTPQTHHMEGKVVFPFSPYSPFDEDSLGDASQPDEIPTPPSEPQEDMFMSNSYDSEPICGTRQLEKDDDAMKSAQLLLDDPSSLHQWNSKGKDKGKGKVLAASSESDNCDTSTCDTRTSPSRNGSMSLYHVPEYLSPDESTVNRSLLIYYWIHFECVH